MEQVLTVRRAAFFEGEWPQGLLRLDRAAAAHTLHRFESSATFVARDAAETDPSQKQLIPYCAVLCGDRVFCVERLSSQGEARLHGRLSIGIGGHINPVDGIGPGVVVRALRRELHEELVLPSNAADQARLVALLNDDTDDVGRVHVGLVFTIHLQRKHERNVHVREISKMRGAFGSLAGSAGLCSNRGHLESWSRLLIDELSLLTDSGATQDSLEGDDE